MNLKGLKRATDYFSNEELSKMTIENIHEISNGFLIRDRIFTEEGEFVSYVQDALPEPDPSDVAREWEERMRDIVQN